MEDNAEDEKANYIYDWWECGWEEAWVRGENRSMWAMMVPLLGMCIWIISGLSISKYTADYTLLGSEAKEIIEIGVKEENENHHYIDINGSHKRDGTAYRVPLYNKSLRFKCPLGFDAL